MTPPLLLAHQSQENYIPLTWYSQKKQEEVPRVIIAMLSDYTLWHKKMGHTHQCMIKHLGKNMENGPHQTTKAPISVDPAWLGHL